MKIWQLALFVAFFIYTVQGKDLAPEKEEKSVEDIPSPTEDETTNDQIIDNDNEEENADEAEDESEQTEDEQDEENDETDLESNDDSSDPKLRKRFYTQIRKTRFRECVRRRRCARRSCRNVRVRGRLVRRCTPRRCRFRRVCRRCVRRCSRRCRRRNILKSRRCGGWRCRKRCGRYQ